MSNGKPRQPPSLSNPAALFSAAFKSSEQRVKPCPGVNPDTLQLNREDRLSRRTQLCSPFLSVADGVSTGSARSPRTASATRFSRPAAGLVARKGALYLLSV